MKKILLYSTLLLVLIFPSCSDSSDGDTPASTVTAKIDGVDYTFNTINVDTETFEGYTDVIITASINSNPNNRISFIVEQGQLGLDASYYFSYFFNETAHPKTENFQTNVTESTNHRVVGTFSGDVQADEAPFDTLEIT